MKPNYTEVNDGQKVPKSKKLSKNEQRVPQGYELLNRKYSQENLLNYAEILEQFENNQTLNRQVSERSKSGVQSQLNRGLNTVPSQASIVSNLTRKTMLDQDLEQLLV